MFRKIIYLIFFVSVLWLTAVQAQASDIAFYVGAPNPDWYNAAQMNADVATIIDQTGRLFMDIQEFDDSGLPDFAAFGAWVDDNTNDGEMDIIWLNGCMPSVLYQFPNENPDGSRAELWLDGGNMIINVADWFAYCSYEGGTRQADNGGAGAENILDLPGIIANAGGTMLPVTATGKQYLPSLNLNDPAETDRPVVLSAVVAPWEVAAVFAGNATHADPIVLYNTVTDGYVAFINQADIASSIADRGLTCAEFIGNWVDEVIGLRPATWAHSPDPRYRAVDVSVDTDICWSPGQGAVTHEIYFGTDPGALPLVATQAVGLDCYHPGDPNIVASTTYYWYVVETEANSVKHTPDVPWSFTTVRGEDQARYPADGAMITGDPEGDNIYTELKFTPGATTVKHTGYCSDDYSKVAGRDQDANLGPVPFPGYGNVYFAGNPSVPPMTDSLVRGTRYYWTVDGTDAKGNTFPGSVWWFDVRTFYAFEPDPPNEAVFIPPDVLLTWSPGFGVEYHDVYIGTSWEDVNNVVYDISDPPPEFMDTVYDPNYQCSGLAGSTKYYWRVDEVVGRGPPLFIPKEFYKGDVWCFSTLPEGVGQIREDLWWNIPGGIYIDLLYADPRFPGNPDQTKFLNSFNTGPNKGDDYGGMIHGWLHPEKSGDYTFWLCADDQAELFLSTDETRSNMQLLANESGSRGPLTWGFGGEEESVSIPLVYGKKYYIRACYKEAGGNDHCQVAWQGPDQPLLPVDGQAFAVIPGNRLEPFVQLWAHDPDPSNGQLGVPTTSNKLRWGPGDHADKHDVYFSTDKALVESRDVSVFKGRIDANEISVSLSIEELYYWVVDEVNETGPDPCLWSGDTWRFRTERTAGSAGGLLGLYYHWWPARPGEPPPQEPYFREFVMSRIDPNVDWDWGDGSPDPLVNVEGFVCKWVGHVETPIDANYTFYTETDDGARLLINDQDVLPADSWTQGSMRWYSSEEIYLTAGLHDIEMHMYEHAGGAGARLAWSAIPLNPLDDPISRQITPPYWLWPPLFAHTPKPANGALIDERKPALEWMPGLYADTHEVYFSSNRADVNDRETAALVYNGADPCYPYPPSEPPLDLDTEYYWLVDEYAGPESWLARSVWSFKTAECVALDNMEDYNDRSDMRRVWTDGYANVVWAGVYPYLQPVTDGSSGSNLNASTEVGSPYGATDPIHGGDQAMALYYDNDGETHPPIPGEEHFAYDAPYYSEVEANTVENLDVKENWVDEGVKSLTLWYQGHPISDGSYNTELVWPKFTVKGRGRDIGGRHDEFYFFSLYPLKDAGYITVDVLGMDNTDGSAKAGLMMREKMTPYSRYAAVFVTPGNGVTLQWRDREGGDPCSVTNPGLSAPIGLKLQRVGAGFMAYYDRGNGEEDVNDPATGEYAFPTFFMDPCTYVGSAVTSHNADAICSADFDDMLTSQDLGGNYVFGNIGLNDAEQMYVALRDGSNRVSVVNNPDPDASLWCTNNLADWQEWNIPLTDFTDLDFSSVKKIYVGFGDRDVHPEAGGKGIVYIDDIRTCPPRCIPSKARPYADIAEPYDCTVNEKDLRVLADEWLFETQFQDWEYRVAYWDAVYPTNWAEPNVAEAVRDYLELNGYTVLDANELKTWMDARIADEALSVVVLCQDIPPDTVVETMDANCTLRRYLNAGGKVVMYADIPFYNQGHADGTWTNWAIDGSINILGFNAAGAGWGSGDTVTITTAGTAWGLTQPWPSIRPALAGDVDTVLATDSDGDASAWAKHYVPGDNYRGFVYIADFDVGEGDAALLPDLLRVAESKGTLAADLHKDDAINFRDYSYIAGSWLETVLWP